MIPLLFEKLHWLSDKSSAPFYIDRSMGRQIIADELFNELSAEDKYHVRWREAILDWLPAWLPHLEQYNAPSTLNEFGIFLLKMKRYVNSHLPLARCLDLRKTTLPAGHLDIASSMNNLACLLDSTGYYAEAEPLYREAFNIVKAASPEGHLNNSVGLNNVGVLLFKTGCFAEAEPLLREALEIKKSVLAEGHPEVAESLCVLAGLLNETCQYAEAETLFRESIKIWKAAMPAGNPDITIGLVNFRRYGAIWFPA